jgi:hypothetical protein
MAEVSGSSAVLEEGVSTPIRVRFTGRRPSGSHRPQRCERRLPSYNRVSGVAHATSIPLRVSTIPAMIVNRKDPKALAGTPRAAASDKAPVGAALREAIYDRILRSVLEHRLPPGTKLVEDRLAELFETSRAQVRDVLARVEMGVEDVDELVLVGGTSRMARLRALLRETFGRDLNCDVSPEEAVAHGTAIQAAILTDRKKISVGASEAALHEHIHVER